MKKITALILILALSITLIRPETVYGSATVKLNKTKLELHEGETYSLKLKGSTGTVKWSSNKKSVATVSSKGKVKAIKEGQATITATYNNKKYKCTVTVLSGKKTDVILTAFPFSGSTVEDYIESVKTFFPDYLDIKAYDEQHIAVTVYETDRLEANKNINDSLIEYISSLLSDDSTKGVFTGYESDDLFQNIKLYTKKTVYEASPYALLIVSFNFAIISDVVQAVNLIDPAERVCNISVVDNTTGEVLYTINII